MKVYLFQKSQKTVLSGSRENSEMERVSSECEDANLRCTRYGFNGLNESGFFDWFYRSMNNATGDALDKNHSHTNSSHSRSLRSNLTYTFNEPMTPQRTSSLYAPCATRSSRPESMNMEVGGNMNFEPATRVSSFRRETKTAQTLSIVVGGFVACWLPFFIFYLLTPFLPEATLTEGKVSVFHFNLSRTTGD